METIGRFYTLKPRTSRAEAFSTIPYAANPKSLQIPCRLPLKALWEPD